MYGVPVPFINILFKLIFKCVYTFNITMNKLNVVFNRNSNVYSFVSFNVQQIFASGWYYHEFILPTWAARQVT